MSKHTPGPWKLEQQKARTKYEWIVYADGRLIANVDNNRQGDANANLIAAAPDLYNVAKYVFDNCDTDSVLGALLETALRKAEGRP